MIKIETLPRGSYEFDKKTFTLRSKRLSFGIGEAVTVAVARTDVTAGKIELRNVNCVKLDMDTTMGEVSIDNVVADRASVDATTGSIKLKGLDAQSISLSATAGSIKGELAGSRDDYSISSSVSLGSSNIKSGGSGTRSLNVECTTGSVSVKFADD